MISYTVPAFDSLELSFVRNEDKSLRVPRVVFSDREDIGGCYYPPQKAEELINNVFVPQDRGIVLVSSHYSDDTAGNLAHEWRHHWQYCHGWKFDSVYWPDTLAEEDYDDAIYKYFTESKTEMDALRFQISKQPNFTMSDHWRSLLPDNLFAQ